MLIFRAETESNKVAHALALFALVQQQNVTWFYDWPTVVAGLS